jgi:gas vesicle protein
MSKHGFGKFAIGAGIGALIGILIAPKKGSETREELKVKYEEFLKKVKSLSKEDIQEEFQIKIEKLKKEIEELDKEKVLNVAKEKAKLVKRETQKLVDLAKEKGTPVLEKTADDIRVKAIDVTKNVLEKLENADKKAKEGKENK